MITARGRQGCGQRTGENLALGDAHRVDEAEAWIAEIVARQDGVISRQQALHTGMSPGRIRRRLDTSRWLNVHPGVYRSAEHPETDASRVRAAALWGGPNAFLAGHAAAWWWGLTKTPPATVDIVIPRNEHRRSRPGIRVIRRPLRYADKASHRSAQVTGLALSALAGSVALGREGPQLLDRALQTRVAYAQVRSAYHRNIGSAGNARAGELVRAAADRSAAESERLFVRLLKEAGIAGWQLNYPWNPADQRRIDVAFVRALLAIEIDGWAWHHQPDRFQRDRTKQNDLAAAGWTVLRFTWFDLTDRPDEVVRRVRAHLARSGS